jgi:hypothetical protein
MKNITLSVDDETYRQARLLAAKREQSVSALVRDLITESASNPALATGEPRAQFLLRAGTTTSAPSTPETKCTTKKTQTAKERPGKEMSFLEFMRASPLYGLDIDLTRDKSLPRDFSFDK